ncbi:Rossmann-fold NAD(P)-binding domain-containing protein [Actinoalloteichus hymeniacidonis]|nr:NAD(P)H-binding protein [Actinoalloteichus hymeniacidonis]MBB5910595.1 uncharacterized protein YbjT (DUF2867 family) [Actinoalloteichus hymeniacidonis]
MTQNDSRDELILVLGGTGKTGRRVADRLTRRGRSVRIGSRTGDPSFDWADASTWDAALAGVTAVYITYYPDVAFPEAAARIRALTTLAVRGGARRLVLLSGRGEEGAAPAERAVRDTDAEWTILRASWFNQNFSEHFLLAPVLGGEIALPAGEVTEPFIDVDDIAEVAVVALTESGHAGQTYELTGPRLLTFTDIAAEITAAAGREIRYRSVSPAQYAAGAEEAGVPAEEIAGLTDLFTRVLDGRNSHTTDDVLRILGREARDFSSYARAVAAMGVWNTGGQGVGSTRCDPDA